MRNAECGLAEESRPEPPQSPIATLKRQQSHLKGNTECRRMRKMPAKSAKVSLRRKITEPYFLEVQNYLLPAVSNVLTLAKGARVLQIWPRP